MHVSFVGSSRIFILSDVSATAAEHVEAQAGKEAADSAQHQSRTYSGCRKKVVKRSVFVSRRTVEARRFMGSLIQSSV